MIYKNDDYRAVLAMEEDRTGNYGRSYDDYGGSYDDFDGYDGYNGYAKCGGYDGYEKYGGGYGDVYDEDVKECPVCGALYPEKFYIDDDEECVGCDICVHEVDELY